MKLNLFIYQGEHYVESQPSKALFRSTMVHAVVMRGDIFATRLRDGRLTIINGAELVEHVELDLPLVKDRPVQYQLIPVE